MGRPKKKVTKKVSARRAIAEAPKKRGRPRKEVEAPKKRGRPKKVETTEVKRRGRPKKEVEVVKTRSSLARGGRALTKQDLVREATGPARNVAVSDAELRKAQEVIDSLDASSKTQIKKAFNQVERKDWNKHTHISVNGSLKIVLTEAVAQVLEI